MGRAAASQEPAKPHSPSSSSCSDTQPVHPAWDPFIVFSGHKQPRQRKCLFHPSSRSRPHYRHTLSPCWGHWESLRVPLFPASNLLEATIYGEKNGENSSEQLQGCSRRQAPTRSLWGWQRGQRTVGHGRSVASPGNAGQQLPIT